MYEFGYDDVLIDVLFVIVEYKDGILVGVVVLLVLVGMFLIGEIELIDSVVFVISKEKVV